MRESSLLLPSGQHKDVLARLADRQQLERRVLGVWIHSDGAAPPDSFVPCRLPIALTRIQIYYNSVVEAPTGLTCTQVTLQTVPVTP